MYFKEIESDKEASKANDAALKQQAAARLKKNKERKAARKNKDSL